MDFNVTRTPQGWECSTVVDGHRFWRHYIGYSKRDAMAEFRKELGRFAPRRNPDFSPANRGFQSFRRAVAFFKEYAGYSTPPGRMASAMELAKAEEWAKRHDVEFYEEPDPDPDLSWMTPEERRRSHEVIGVIAKHPNGQQASVWGVVDADSNYLRVVRAELASELKAGFR